MEQKRLTPRWLECYFELAPWWTLGIFILGFLPGYLWWLITGDPGAARTVLAVSLRASLVLVALDWAVLTLLIPFWTFSSTRLGSSSKECWSFAILGAWLLGCAAALGVAMPTREALLTARIGTVVFFAGIFLGRALQKAVHRQLEMKADGSNASGGNGEPS